MPKTPKELKEKEKKEKVVEKKVETEVMPTNAKTQIKKGFIATVGRRKTAVARVFLYQEKGDITVNDASINNVYATEKEKNTWMKPFYLLGISHPETQFSGSIKVNGSGKSAQLGAIVLAFSRALASINDEYNKTLRKHGLLTRDPRMVERKKYYLVKARKAPQYSKR